MRRPIVASELNDTAIHVVGQRTQRGAGERAASIAVIAKNDRKTRDHKPNFFCIKIGTRTGTKRRYSLCLQGLQVRSAVIVSHAVKQQCDLAVVAYNVLLLEMTHELGKSR